MKNFSFRLRRAFIGFHLTLAAVLFSQSLLLVVQTTHLHLKALGLIEAVAAVLFVVPITLRIGAWVLLFSFALAAGVHLLAGEWPGTLLVYAAGTVFVWLHGSPFPKAAQWHQTMTNEHEKA